MNSGRPGSGELEWPSVAKCRSLRETMRDIRFRGTESVHHYNKIEDAVIVHGTLRTGVTMMGVFATQNIHKGTFLCAWTGIMCRDTDALLKLVNGYDTSKYGIQIGDPPMYVCPPLDNDGKPFCSAKDGHYDIDRGNANQSMAVFLNEPSNHEHCIIGEDYAPTVVSGSKPNNVCLLSKYSLECC